MFDNIGGKIKALAKMICCVGIASSVIFGIVLINAGANTYRGGETLEAIGVVVMVAGSLLSWVGAFFTYGFGEMVENSCIQTELAVKKAKQEEAEKKPTPPKANTDWVCENCGTHNRYTAEKCDNCGTARAW